MQVRDWESSWTARGRCTLIRRARPVDLCRGVVLTEQVVHMTKLNMTPDPDLFDAIASAIQLALTPAFLLTGIAGLLNVMSGRLARVIDRGRAVNTLKTAGEPLDDDELTRELRTLEQRRRFTSIAITSTTISALLVCVVIALLFIKGMLNVPMSEAIGALFAVAMLALVAGLGFFLREMHLAMRCIRLANQDPV